MYDSVSIGLCALSVACMMQWATVTVNGGDYTSTRQLKSLLSETGECVGV